MHTILNDLYTGLRDRLLEGLFWQPRLQPAIVWEVRAAAHKKQCLRRGSLSLRSGEMSCFSCNYLVLPEGLQMSSIRISVIPLAATPRGDKCDKERNKE